MRILIILCAVLILANVGVFLWPDDANVASHVFAPKDDVNPHFVRLNKEVQDEPSDKPVVSIAAGEEIASADDDVVKAGEACYRIGPFMQIENYELAQATLADVGVNFRKSKRTSRSSNVYRVFLGPYETQAEVADMRAELKRKNVLDHFVRKQEDENLIISLGIYSTAETAETALRLFDGTLEDVQKQNETVVLPDSYWLHFPNLEESSPHAQLANADWGEQSAKMGLYSCDL